MWGRFLRILLLFISLNTFSQEYTDEYLMAQPYDSLMKLHDVHFDIYTEENLDSLLASRIARVYMKKAIADNDSIKIARAYERLSFSAKYEDAIELLDSCIYYSKNSNHENYPTVAYLFKAYYHARNNNIEPSLASAILAYNSAKKKDNVNYQISALSYISTANEYWGDYNKNLSVKHQTLRLIEDNPEVTGYDYHLGSSLQGIAISYIRLKKLDSAMIYIKRGIDQTRNESIPKVYAQYLEFVALSGAVLYFNKEYDRAIDSLDKAYVGYGMEAGRHFMYNYYIGNTYYEQGKVEFGIRHLLKSDSIYQEDKKLYPEVNVLYRRIVDHYKDLGEKELQLEYLNKLVSVDSLIGLKRQEVQGKTIEEFYTPQLFEERDELIADLESKNKKSTTTLWWISGFAVLSVLGLGYYFNKQRLYKKRFISLMQSSSDEELDRVEVPAKNREIPEDIFKDILLKLEGFEQSKKYLATDLTIQNLAKSFNTNANYLSKVINSEKGKNFSQYLKDLRTEYAFNELRENHKFRKFTVKAIANECGFKSGESFSKAFYKKYGIYPSYYIKKLDTYDTHHVS